MRALFLLPGETRPRAGLWYPAYWEDVEESPAHILLHTFSGQGYHYRQCFLDGKILSAEYDAIFPDGHAAEDQGVAAMLCFDRLRWPWNLTEKAKASYREFLDYYLWFFNQHIPTIRKSQGGSKDWRQTFDELSAKPFQPKSKQALLERCIKEIGENFSAQDVNSYLDKYIHITQDTLLPDRIRDQYNLSADANQLLLKDIHGKPANLNRLLEKNRGKVIYVDFWASWCGPCRAQEPHLVRLYQEYKDRGFGILGISLDVNTASWLSVLAKKENLWPELCIAGKEDDKRIRELYSITGIPFGVLLDKSGKIISVVNAGWQHLKMILNEYYKADDKRSAK